MRHPKGAYWAQFSASSQPQIVWQLEDNGSERWAAVQNIAYLNEPPIVIRRIVPPDTPPGVIIEEGAYWVRVAERTEPEIAYYNGYAWRLPGDGRYYSDNRGISIRIIEGPLHPKVSP